MPAPFVSKKTFAQDIGPASLLLGLSVSEGDYVFAIVRSRPGGGIPNLATIGASSSWTTVFARDSMLFAYRKAIADEITLQVVASYPGGFGGTNFYNADAYLLAVTGATRIDITSNVSTGGNANATLDGWTAAATAGGVDAVGLAVLFSADGFALPLAALFSDSGFGAGQTSLVGPTAVTNAVPAADHTWISILAGGPTFIEFPRTIEYKAIGGDSFLTTITTSGGGAEDREKNRTLARRKWKVSLVTPDAFRDNPQDFVDLMLGFFLNSAGKAYSFRVYDHVDHVAQGEPLVLTDAGWQLAKRYQVGDRTYVRNIYKPITSDVFDWQGNPLPDTVKLYSDGSPVGSFSVDAETGIVTTGAGGVLTADFEFDYPARFDTDELMLQIEEGSVGEGQILVSANNLDLIEVLPKNF